jgi:tetratricopeptide (TPR) repeat protein
MLGMGALSNAWAASDTYFKQANDQYQAGQFEKAISLYEKSPYFKTGSSSEVFYNLGNSYFKTGQVGKSIVNYERALDLDPRSSDVRYNLEYAKSTLRFKTEDKLNWYLNQTYQALRWIRKEECILLAAVAGFIYLMLMAFSFKWPAVRLIQSGARIWMWGAVFFTLMVGLKILVHPKQPAIITTTSAAAYFGPSETETIAFHLNEGLKVEILHTSGNWYEILLPNRQSGWIQKSNLEKILLVSS